ncbi:stealth family protein [Enterococcus eurekensis]|uniref:Stealth family protein n=1 Tax=Enterococcus eurekensis TaxID=1159753 RepID=A0ABV9M0Z2_9ENTE
MDKIDLVILWVDGSDSEWRNKRSKIGDLEIDEVRYRDYGTLKYLFRSIEENCDWVNNIHLITDNQKPEWLNLSNPKINLVYHQDFIPQEYLPTFNSNVIELNLFRLEALSDKFILFNDDMFFNNKVEPEDFFIGDKILDYGVYNKIAPNEEFAHTLLNNLIIINEHFIKKETMKKNWRKQFKLRYGKNLLKNFLLLPWNDIPGYYNHHLPQPHFKSMFEKLYKLESKKFEDFFPNKVRGKNDLNHWIFRYWLLEEGRYLPQSKKFGEYLLLSDTKNLKEVILEKKAKVVCINDVECTDLEFEILVEKLNSIFEERYSTKSQYEY